MSETRAEFSASDAALEGVQLLRREWRTVLGWAGFNLIALIMLVVLSVLLGLIAAALSGGDRGPVAALLASVIGLGGLAIQVIIATGVFRLELRPEEPAFMRLRLGKGEMKLAPWLLLMLLPWLFLLTALLAGTLGALPLPWLVLVPVVAYLDCRWCLAGSIGFVDRGMGFRQSWKLTRRRAPALFGMCLLTACVIGLLVSVLFVVLALVALGSSGLDGVAGLFGGSDALQRHPGLYVLEFAVEIVLTPVLWVLGIAPTIAAYRALSAAAPAR